MTSLFWSPDSRSVGFFADGKLKRSDLNGGPPEILCDAAISGRLVGTWSRNGIILFHSGGRGGLRRVSATGGVPAPVTFLDSGRQEAFHVWPQFLPDGRHFIYLSQSEIPENTGIYVGSLDSKESKRVANISTNPSYAISASGVGHLLFMQGATLMAQAFDTQRLELKGERFPVAEQVLMPPANALGYAAFSASANGVLVYRTVHETTELVWFDRQGRRLGAVAEPGNYTVPALSPDEKRLAVRRTDTQIGTHDLWLFDLVRKKSSRFTFDPGEETNPTWSPDGSRIAFSWFRSGAFSVYRKTATGATDAEPMNTMGLVESWSPDGRFVLYDLAGKLWALPVAGSDTPMALFQQINRGHRVTNVSPNSKWVAYDSNESGRNEVWVQSFPQSGGKAQVSTKGGEEPYWRRDGKELFYVEGQRLMAIDVSTTGQNFQFGPPKPLFDMRLETDSRRSRYQVAANGQKFLVNVPLEPAQSAPITVVTNWTAELKR